MFAPHNLEECPLESVHRRLDDAHRLWHQALDSYFDPDGFRVALQACVQALRTVTWVLQNNKSVIPSFESWYQIWQSRMRDDAVMRWLVDARNRIEKRGDLESYSQLRASVIASYLGQIDGIEVKASLFETVNSILKKIHPDSLNQQVLKHGALKIERRWMENNLPKHELLDALAHVYGMLSNVLDDAHCQIGFETNLVAIPEDGASPPASLPGAPRDGRLPCMVGVEQYRTMLFSFSTGERINIAMKTETLSGRDIEKIEKRHEEMKIQELKPKEGIRSIKDLARWYFICGE